MKTKLPQVKSVKAENNSATLELFVDDNIKYFEGHFDDFALLPGVVQLHWAVYFAHKYLDVSAEIKDVEVLKFQKVLLPNSTVMLELLLRENGKVNFIYSSKNEEKYSAGRLVYPS